jgi:uncharacterized protein
MIAIDVLNFYKETAMKHHLYNTVVLLIAFCLLAASFAVAGETEIKARMLDRLPLINDYKARGVVGEDNHGFLQVIGAAGEWSEVAAAENNDRKMVYQAIAGKTAAPVETVGVRRALQIRESALPGTWIQADDGKWVKK